LVSITEKSQVVISASVTAVSDDLSIAVFVRNISDQRFDVDESQVNVQVFYNDSYKGSGAEITPGSACVTTTDSIQHIVKGMGMFGRYSLPKLDETPFVFTAPVRAAVDFMLDTERKHYMESTILAVGNGLLSAMVHDSETARAIDAQTNYFSQQAADIKFEELMKGLSIGLFQRHTIWPGKSYMGEVIATVTSSYRPSKISSDAVELPPPSLYQICVTTGDDVHTFVLLPQQVGK
jgi:hypothetical protein